VNRYKNNNIIGVSNAILNKPKYATSELCSQIYQACESGEIPFIELEFKNGDRLDHLAARYYGNGLDWWLIAAASGISWWLQVNEETRIKIPNQDSIKRRFKL
jgi:hypothetical protein